MKREKALETAKAIGTQKTINEILKSCFLEFCEHNDGCIGCPYIEHTMYSEERDYDCEEAYIRSKLEGKT